jgi:glycosyltransferase involved in cell wall biosynthesis
VGEVAHELIVVDTGSTDETPLIATRYGARGIALDFTMADFSRARNYAIERARDRSTQGLICSWAFLFCCTSRIWRRPEPISRSR